MPRIPWPVAALAVGGFVGVTCLVFTTYTRPMEGASADPALYDLIASAIHAPLLPQRPLMGHSPLPVAHTENRDTTLESREPPHPASAAPSQPREWAERAAALDSSALGAWLGSGVLAVRRTNPPDTLQLTLYRITFRAGCPLLSRLVASSVGLYGSTPELVHVRATCPSEVSSQSWSPEAE